MSLLTKFPDVNLIAVLVASVYAQPLDGNVLRRVVQMDAMRQFCVRRVLAP